MHRGLRIVGWHAYLCAEVQLLLLLRLGDDTLSLSSSTVRRRRNARADSGSPIGPEQGVKLPIGVFVVGYRGLWCDLHDFLISLLFIVFGGRRNNARSSNDHLRLLLGIFLTVHRSFGHSYYKIICCRII